MSLALALRMALAPTLVAVATLLARRWGAPAAGWAASTPVVAGPVLLVVASDHGTLFGSQAAGSATLGLVSLAIFTVVYARLGGAGLPWAACLIAGWASFVVATLFLSMFTVPTLWALVTAVVAFRVCRLTLGTGEDASADARRLPGDIPLRMTAALLMVATLAVVAGMLGPRLSGLLTPFPIIGSVMAVFTHVTRGRGALGGYSDALLKGLPSFALFTATVGLMIVPLGMAAAFILATLVAAVSHTALIYLDVRSSGGREDLPPTRAPGVGSIDR
ncbi:MAG: hypothetical protein ABR598_05810 [Candidatus Dormibacteria bacterium]